MVDKVRYEVLYYQTSGGRSPAKEFLEELPVKAREKAAKWINKLEEYGPDLSRPLADILRDKIRELRFIFASQQYRLLYFFYGKYIVITHGLVKKTDQIPEAEIEKAKMCMEDFQTRIKMEGYIP